MACHTPPPRRLTAVPACPPAPATVVSPAVAARIRQLAAQAEHRCAIADFHARHLADQQARINALLVEAIAALASLFGETAPPASSPQARARPHQP